MADYSSEAARARQVGEIYEALGKFVVEFSLLVHSMETGLLFAVGGNQQLLRAVTAELTADPLARAWRSVMVRSPGLDGEDRRVLSSLCNEITDLISLRNDWSHGTWLIGFGNAATTDWSWAALDRFKNSSDGLARPARLEVLPTAAYISDVASYVSLVTQAVFDFTFNTELLREKRTSTHPHNRIRITRTRGHHMVEISSNGTDWRSSEMPSRRTQADGPNKG